MRSIAVSPALLLAILTGINFLNYFDRFILSAVLESVRTEYALSDTDAGVLATAFIFGYFVTSPIFGYFGDRGSRRFLICAGVFVWSLGTVLTAFAPSYGWLIACRVLVGVGEASYATISPSLLSDVFPPKSRNFALTVFYVAIPLGAAIGTLFGSWVGALYGWHYAFIFAGAPGLLLAFALYLLKEPARGAADGLTSVAPASFKEMTSLLRNSSYMLALAGYVCYTFALGAYQHWGQAFLQRVHGMQQTDAGNYFGGVMVVAGLLGTFVGGWLGTQLQRRFNYGYALLLTISTLIALPFAYLISSLPSTSSVLVCMALAMVLFFFITGPINTVILEAVPVNVRSTAMAGSIFAIHAFGDLWSPTIVGRASDAWGGLQYGLGILPFAITMSVTFWGLLTIRLRHPIKPKST
jgi:predicted MFS family arabinose efflux permease